MSSAAIRVENLSKRYTLSHQRDLRRVGQYQRFSDVLANIAEAPLNWFGIGDHKPRSKDTSEEFWALKNVSFEIKQGEVVGIIGRNGAGKSTLLKILSRITEPTQGRIELEGRVASLLEVGTGFHPELTGRENIFLNGAILGMSRAEIKSKFDEIVSFAEVEKFLDTPVKRYSSGMYVRLAFAVAAHLEPEILVVDEVLAVGDAEFQKKCLGKMEKVAEELGRTVLFVSHNLAQITKLCEKCVYLEKGKVKMFGDTSLVTQSYLLETSSAVSANARVDLASSDGSVHLIKYSLGGSGARPIQTGGSWCIEMFFRFIRAHINPGFVVSIRTLQGTELLKLSTFPISGVYTGRCEGEVKCRLEIDRLQLAAGVYCLAVGLSNPNVGYLIPVTELARFEVQAADVYNSGFSVENVHGFTVADHRWQIKSIL